MKILLLWLCTTAAMTDCTVEPISERITPSQCRELTKVYTQVLGAGPDQNYRLECADA